MSTRLGKTLHRLHFSDLDPLRFEDLCLSIVFRLKAWKEINHFGRTGKDNGVDIHAFEEVEGKPFHWHIQCKRFAKITKTDIKNIFLPFASEQNLPQKFLLIISCDMSRSLYDFFKYNCTQLGIHESEVWTASTLETRLFKDYKDLLFSYFGVNLENRKPVDNAARVRHSLRMQKRMEKDFLSHEFLKDSRNWELMHYEPYNKFVDYTVYIRSVDDKTYPVYKDLPHEKISPWFKTMLYDFYHNGIELWVNAAMGHEVIIDKNGYWELVDHYDERKKDPQYKVVRVHMLARIPFSSIVDYNLGGDEYSSEPHIFCRFEHDGAPYEKIYYKTYGYYKQRWFPSELDDQKQIKTPK